MAIMGVKGAAYKRRVGFLGCKSLVLGFRGVLNMTSR